MKKKIAILLIAIIAVSCFSAISAATAMPFMHWKVVPRMHGPIWRNSNVQTSFVRFNGVIAKWGTTNVTGGLLAQARTIVYNTTDIREGSTVTAMWTANNSRPIYTFRDKVNFTYTFYTARLVNASDFGLNVEGNDFYLEGNWTVFKVSSNITITTNADGDIINVHRDQDATALATKANGKLNVTDNWSNFTIAITGIDQLNGTVHFQRITSKMCNPFKIGEDDANTVTPAELTTMTKAYGAMPGWGNYNQAMDYNFNYRVDICDLVTAASNVNA